ncbi:MULTISPECIES: LlsX family protein [Lactobacillaceae]|uniref:LlsX family protein n=1 Tax=Lactobacillaceae TaxID=33958 RepID=UPI0014563887|nr:LlsX family protein [Lactobacillus sp. HBUAS51381]NLR09185.1 LlsX family protein [Lactobacillus sp. HBUAS51381]
MSKTVVRLTIEIIGGMIVSAGLLSLIISSTYAYVQASGVTHYTLNLLGLPFFRISYVAGHFSGYTHPGGMGLTWLLATVGILALGELRHRIVTHQWL